ncbi:MAG TPA: ABC transporter ATP-binding protein, partial [Flavisolibacter sp.]|nr:ABC transporter ATP-binding protein [Flavisolibacter sp.]
MKRTSVFARLFSYVLRYRKKLVLLAVISLVGVGFEVAKPLPVKLIIDSILSNHPLPDFFTSLFTITAGWEKQQLLFFFLALLILVTVGSALLSLVVFNFTVNLSQRLVYDLSVDFFSKLQRLSLTFHARNQVGDLLQRMNGDVFVVYFLVAQITLPVITSLVCLTGMFYVMVKIDLVLALIAFSVIPLLGVSLAFFAKPMNDTTMTQYTRHGQLSAFVQQCLSSMKVIQAFGRESFMYNKLKTHAHSFSHAFKVANRVSMTFNQLSALITGLASAAVIGVGAYRGLQGGLSTGDLFVFLGYITALYGPVTSLSTAISTALTLKARGQRIFDIIDSKEVVPEKYPAKQLGVAKGAVEFRNVTFGYDDRNSGRLPVLNEISFIASPGQIVAIVGPTGAGKTSLISLLTRFYDP